MSRLQRLVAEVDRLLGRFQIGEAGRRLHDFFWSEYCDWYLEMAKVRLKAGDPSTSAGGGPASGGISGQALSPLPVLAQVLDTCLRLLHPFMPFVTEAAWQSLREHITWAESDALIVAPWPKAERKWIDRDAETNAQVVMEIVRAIRNIRADRGVDPGRYVEAYVAADGPSAALSERSIGVRKADRTGARPVLEAARPILESLARVRPLHLVTDISAAPRTGVASAVLAEAQVLLPLAGLMDLEQERSRLSKQLAEAEAEVQRAQGKLANRAFRDKAPPAVVAKEEEKLAAARSRLDGLQQRLAELG